MNPHAGEPRSHLRAVAPGDTEELLLKREAGGAPGYARQTPEGRSGPPPHGEGGYDWMALGPVPSAAQDGSAGREARRAAELQMRLRELALSREQVALEQDEEDLLAARRANELAEDATARRTKALSRKWMVSLIRSVVVLLALIWLLFYLALSDGGSRLAHEVTPQAIIRYASELLEGAVKHPPPSHPGGESTTRAPGQA